MSSPLVEAWLPIMNVDVSVNVPSTYMPPPMPEAPLAWFSVTTE